jgi:hypothetical protein
MKMDLQQVVALVAEGDVAAFAVICLNGMAIIDQIDQRHFVMDVEWCDVTGFCRFEVNRRLMLARRACLERGYKVAPMRRSTGTAITPIGGMGFLWHLRRHNDFFSGLGCCRFIGWFVCRHFFVGGCFAFMFGVFRAMRYALCAVAFAPCAVTFALCGGVSAMGFLEALWLSAACALASLGSAWPPAASAPEAPSNANTAMDRKTGL